jgi:hypothetical protein
LIPNVVLLREAKTFKEGPHNGKAYSHLGNLHEECSVTTVPSSYFFLHSHEMAGFALPCTIIMMNCFDTGLKQQASQSWTKTSKKIRFFLHIDLSQVFVTVT